MWERWVIGQRVVAVSEYFAGKASIDTARATATNLANRAFVWSLEHYVDAPEPPEVTAALEVGKLLLGTKPFSDIVNSTLPVNFIIEEKCTTLQIRKSETVLTCCGSKSDVNVARAVWKLARSGRDTTDINTTLKQVNFADGTQPIEIVASLFDKKWCRTRCRQLSKTAAALSACKSS